MSKQNELVQWESEDEKWNDKLYMELHPEQFEN